MTAPVDDAVTEHALAPPAVSPAPVPSPVPAAPRTRHVDRYFVLAGAVVVLMASHLLKNRWGGGLDIWEHAAAVRELAAHPLHPHHPLLLMDKPHQFLSPYSLVLGLTARVSGMHVTTVLNLAGFANLVMVLVALRLFLRKLTGRPQAAFYALLFILTMWGVGAWFFSGFLHFDVLALVLPYPSTFAKGLVLVAFWCQLKFLESDDERWLLATFAIGYFVILSHPVDAVFLYVGVAALTIADRRTTWRTLVSSALPLAASLALAFAWPYYSLYDLLFGPGNAGYRAAIAGADHDMYIGVLGRVYPALLAVPFVVRRLARDIRDPLALMVVGLCAAYAYGAWSHNWSYGRIISDIMVALSMVLAAEVASIEDGLAGLGPAARPMAVWLRVTVTGLVLFGLFNVRNGFNVLPQAVLDHVPYSWVHGYVDLIKLSDFDFLSRYGSEHDVVLSDLYTSLEVPAFGPKVVAPARAEAFVDMGQRGPDVARFYDPQTPEDARRAVLDKYHVSFLLVTRERLAAEPATYRPLLALGPRLYQNARFVLVDVRRAP